MTGYEYDEGASAELRMDVVHEVRTPRPLTAAEWVEASRRLNSINDRLARDLIELHRACGTGNGGCDRDDGDEFSVEARYGWGCATTEAIARHHGVELPAS